MTCWTSLVQTLAADQPARFSNCESWLKIPICLTGFRMGWVPNLVFLRYGPQFQIHRRLFHRYFGPQEAPSYFPYQEHEARILVKNLLASPENYDECFRR